MKKLSELITVPISSIPIEKQIGIVMEALEEDEMVYIDLTPYGELVRQVRRVIAYEHNIPYYKHVAMGVYSREPARLTINPKHLREAEGVKHLSRRKKAKELSWFKRQEYWEKQLLVIANMDRKEKFEQQIIDQINEAKKNKQRSPD